MRNLPKAKKSLLQLIYFTTFLLSIFKLVNSPIEMSKEFWGRMLLYPFLAVMTLMIVKEGVEFWARQHPYPWSHPLLSRIIEELGEENYPDEKENEAPEGHLEEGRPISEESFPPEGDPRSKFS